MTMFGLIGRYVSTGSVEPLVRATNLFVASFGIAASAALAHAQIWGPVTRLTNDPATSYTADNSSNSYLLQIDTAKHVHIVFYDNRTGSFKIYYLQGQDFGNTWSSEVCISPNGIDAQYPTIVAKPRGDILNAFWQDRRDGNFEIYQTRSTDGGITWGTEIRVTNAADSSVTPSACQTGDTIYLVWLDNRDGNKEVYFKRSTDSGISWSGETNLTNTSGYNESGPCVQSAGGLVHVIYTGRTNTSTVTKYIRSTDGGLTWSSPVDLTGQLSYAANLSVDPQGNPHIVWSQNPDIDVYYRHSYNGGTSWTSPIQLSSGSQHSGYPVVSAGASGDVHVAWEEWASGDEEISYKRSLDNGNTWSTEQNLSNMSGLSDGVRVSGYDTGCVFVVWWDNHPGNVEVYARIAGACEAAGEKENITQEKPLLEPVVYSDAMLIVFRVSANLQLSIYSSDGRLVHSGILKKGENRISLRQKGVYFWVAGKEGQYRGKAVIR